MRTVESVVSDLMTWLDVHFRAVRRHGDVYLVPNESLVCRVSPRLCYLVFLLTPQRTRQMQETSASEDVLCSPRSLALRTKRP
jgi:hypothetical protein